MHTLRGATGPLLLIDDDELSREVLGLMAVHAGFVPRLFESGEAAIMHLQAISEAEVPVAILTDLQMPGLTGDALAMRLREVCGTKMRVLAMSGTTPIAGKLTAFDGFLLKPFSAEDLLAAISGQVREVVASAVPAASILNEAIYENFAKGMPAGQLAALYKMSVDDARKRLATMREAAEMSDDAAYRKAAHTIKGGCGMVGAMELADLAATMEREGLGMKAKGGPNPTPPGILLERFVAASERLERMLDAKAHAQP